MASPSFLSPGGILYPTRVCNVYFLSGCTGATAGISVPPQLNTGTAGTIDLAPICPGASVGEVKWQSIGKINILSIKLTLKNDFAYGGTISLITLQNKPLANVISAGAAGGLPVNIFASSSSGYLYIKNNSGTKIAAGSVVRGQIAYIC